ncbi:MAG TPA: NUDIX hydrolase [Acidimicrobiales bacterium]|jgi:8-oxo-dGTP pyrophosphatase MutT (NUDIX family)|nr:NUDIX hydrolase [Acidimicrobiales bacterium]
MDEFVIPRIPASAGGLIRDAEGRLLILKPTYKSGWTIPGGQIEADGESPWEGCRREVLEETGLTTDTGRLVCVDFLRPKGHRPGGLRFLFDCGTVGESARGEIVLQVEEISAHRWVTPAGADRLLSGPVGRRVAQGLAASTGTVYLEEGRPVAGVGR